MLPFFAMVRRREPARPLRIAGRANVRVLEGVYPQRSPDPIRHGDFNDVGKPPVHARSMQQIALTVGIREYHAVMQDSFLIAADRTRRPRAGMPRGAQSPYAERINMERGTVDAYGSIVLLQAGNQ